MPAKHNLSIYVATNLLTGCIIGLLYQRVRDLSAIDHLTQVYNRGYLIQELRRHLSLSQRHDRPVSLSIIDLDRFKLYNDTQGHLAGDRLLQAVATVILCQVRQEDVVARYGGDEFVIVLPHTDGPSALAAMHRIKQALTLTALRGSGVTLSAGIATAPTDACTVEALMNAADKALYLAKEQRDQIVRHPKSGEHEVHHRRGSTT